MGAREKCRPCSFRVFRKSPITLNSLLIFLALFHTTCSKTENKKIRTPELAGAALRIVQAVERAGGSDIWIKAQGEAPAAQHRSGSPVEVLSVPSRFDKVVFAIRHQADIEGLKTETQRKNLVAPSRSIDLRLTRRNELVSQWSIREVPKLLRAAIVIDDLGQDLEAANKLIRQPYPITFSILPRLSYSFETARAAHAAHRAVMLHLPMQPQPGSGVQPGPGEITLEMSNDEVAKIIRADLKTVPFAEGVNNHMGSRATANAVLMAAVMKELAAQGLYFVDSRTTAETRALAMARSQGLPAFYRSVFLDDTQTVAYTLEQLRMFRRVIQEHGVALAIGHPHPTTIEALKDFLPEFERDDIQLISASQLVHLPEASRLQPPGPGINVAQETSSSPNR